MAQRVIRISELASTPDKPGKLPVSPATIWRWVQQGRFPQPFKLGPATTVWSIDQIERHLEQKATRSAR